MDISTDCCTSWAQCIGGVSRFQQWSMEHSHIRRSGSERAHSADARLYRRIVRETLAARAASREEIRVHVARAV